MHKIKMNTNEIIVKVFYVMMFAIYVKAFSDNLLGVYEKSNYMRYYLVLNLIAIYTLIYSIYFLTKNKFEERNLKIILLKKARKISVIVTIVFLLNIYFVPVDPNVETFFYIVFLVIWSWIFVLIYSQFKRCHKYLGKLLIWKD